jgi:PAS domain S-box-containing protein
LSDSQLIQAKVLIVDDQEPNQTLLEGLLKKQGYSNYMSLSDPRQVVSTVQEWAPDIILLDLMMPHMDGFAVMHALKALVARDDYLPILVLTADVTSEAKSRALSEGAMDFLTKPFDANEVTLRVNNLLQTRFLHLELQNQNAILEVKVRERTRALQESEARARVLLKAMPDMMFRLDRNGVVLDYKANKTELYAQSVDGLIGKRNKDVSPAWFGALVEHYIEATLATSEMQIFEYRLPIRGRGLRTYEARMVASGADEVTAVVRDVTEQKQAEKEVKYQARLLRHINDAVIATDDQFRITAWNRAAEKMYGWSSKEVIGRNVSEILSFGLSDEQQAKGRELLLEGSSVDRREAIHQRKDGQTLYVEENTIALMDEHSKLTGYVTVNRDVTERKRAEEHMQLQFQRLKALRAIDIAISSSFNLNLTLDILLHQVISVLNTDAAVVLLFNPQTSTLEYAASRGFRSTAIRESKVRLGEGFAGKAILEHRSLHIPNLMETGDEFTRARLINAEGFVAYYCMPLIVKGEAKGVLEIFHRSVLAGSSDWLDFLEALAAQAAIAIDNATLFEDLQRSNRELLDAYDATIEGWSYALDLRDKETEGHTQRVTEMTLDLAHRFGFTDEKLRYIRWGALLHDIGKVGIPDNILLKPDNLTEDEWESMKKHPTFAYEMLSPIRYLQPALEIPYCHQEKWDGTGYPRGLKGEAIPLVARLFAVVDVWDALRSDRPYRKAWTIEKTKEYIRSQAGRHFDPKVVEYFLNSIKV